jgi:hypothetical protein
MKLLIDLRRKRVKIEFEATQDEMGQPESQVNVEVKTNKRQNKQILDQIPDITGKLLYYLTMTNVVLLDSTYEQMERMIAKALESEKCTDKRPV